METPRKISPSEERRFQDIFLLLILGHCHYSHLFLLSPLPPFSFFDFNFSICGGKRRSREKEGLTPRPRLCRSWGTHPPRLWRAGTRKLTAGKSCGWPCASAKLPSLRDEAIHHMPARREAVWLTPCIGTMRRAYDLRVGTRERGNLLTDTKRLSR